jgi:uncharacterized phage-like protein YoqJ
MIISFTGHRPNSLGGFTIPNPIYEDIYSKIIDALHKFSPTEAIVGMAQGVDQWAASACIELNIPYIAAIPFIGQERVWPDEAKRIYRYYLGNSKKVEIISSGGYAAWKLQKRNEWMVDNCDLLIAVYKTGSTGGTKNCIDYAKSINKEIFIIEVKDVK